MTKIELTFSSEYGIMFLCDSKEIPIFPPDSGVDSVTYTSTCVAFSVLSYVDGDARVILCESSSKKLNRYFSGMIECPSKSISLFDTNGFAFASVPLQDPIAYVSLRMSEERNSEIVECVIENMGAF